MFEMSDVHPGIPGLWSLHITSDILNLCVLENLLLNEQLTVDVLAALHDLTQFENLLPRFSATFPPCWNEIQQEQQQRKHPQHLHQQGEATQHTRTWRLQADRYY